MTPLVTLSGDLCRDADERGASRRRDEELYRGVNRDGDADDRGQQ